MDLANSTAVPANVRTNQPDPEGRHVASLVAKATFRIERGAARLDRDAPFDLFSEDVETELGLLPHDGAARHEDVLEVILHAAAYASPSSDRRSARVALSVGEHRRELVVWGDRRWIDGRLSDADRFERLPMTWDRAFGGSTFVEVDREAVVPILHPTNPCGRGFDVTALAKSLGAALRAPPGYPRFEPDARAPNLEDAGVPVTSPTSDALPACWSASPPEVLVSGFGSLDLTKELGDEAIVRDMFQRMTRRCHPAWALPGSTRGRIRIEGCRPGGEIVEADFPATRIVADYEVAGRCGVLEARPSLLVLLPEEARFYVVYRAWFSVVQCAELSLRLRVEEEER